jgi:large subunit ribosomal protein L7/L12
MPTDDVNLDAELQALVAAGRKIEAIKRYRELTGVGLKEAKDAVEAMMRGASLPSRESADSPFESEIVSLLQGGKKIAAIKLYREKTGVGLKEAKDFIEALAADRRIAAPARSGCLGVLLIVAAIILMIVVKSFAAGDQRPLDFRTIALNGDKGGMLAVVDGQPRLVNSRSAWNEWALRETDKGWTIRGQSSGEKPEAQFLGVDKEGKVILLAELGEGAYWKLTRKGDKTTHSFDATLQASGGKFDGWYLGFSDKQERIEKGRFKYEAYRGTLSEKPGPRTHLYIFVDGP